MDEGTVTSASEWDLTTIHEEEFDNHATYIVPDRSVELGVPNRAEATLPRNLILKTSQALSDVSSRPSIAKLKIKTTYKILKFLLKAHSICDCIKNCNYKYI